MSKPTIAETGWADFLIDHLEEALKAAKGTASDLAKMKMCDGADCGRMFDATDPRAREVQRGRITFNFCPGCELEAQRDAAISSDQRQKSEAE
jgi:hypothetical protein